MTRGRKRALSRGHVDLDEKNVVGEDGIVRSEFKWSCKYCGGDDDGGVRKTVTFPASRFDMHLTNQCTKAPDEVKKGILARSLSSALHGSPDVKGEPGVGDASGDIKPAALNDVKPHSLFMDGVLGQPSTELAAVAGAADSEVTAPSPAMPAPKRRKSKPATGRVSIGGQVMSEARVKVISESIAKFFCGTGLPLSLAATPLFEGLVKELDPTFAAVMEKNNTVDFWYNKCLPQLHASEKTQFERKLVETGSYRTLSLDHFSVRENLFVNIFESSSKMALFYGCQQVGPTPANGDPTLLNAVVSHLEQAGMEACSPVQDVFAGIVGSMGSNRDVAMMALAERYQRLLFVDCARRTLEVILAEIIQLPAIAKIIASGRSIAAYANSPSLVAPGHLSRWKSPDANTDSGPMRPLDAYDLLSELLEKKAEMSSLLEEQFVWDAAKAVANNPVGAAALELFVRDSTTQESTVQCVCLLGPLVRALRLMERNGCGLSWVIPLYTAIVADVTSWSIGAAHCIPSNASSEVCSIVNRLWAGNLRSPVHVFAWLMDPHTTPTPEELPDGFKDDFRSVLARLSPSNKPDGIDHIGQGLKELEGVILREGEWGKVITECQADVALASASPIALEEVPASPPPPLSDTDVVLKKMEVAGDGSRKWRVYGSRHYGALRFGAVRVLSMCAVAGCVENVRVGGIPSAVGGEESDTGTRISNDLVRKLMYVYVNSRLGLHTADKCALERGPSFDFAKEAMALTGSGISSGI